ncbi:MAG TPA: multidrug efflux MFS transporter [Corynebacteriales bacterium]|nr:multidrug efflux MFS transporter [Mycobacteriales bacterium]
MYLSLKIPRAQKDLYLIALGVFIAQVAFSAVTPFLPSYLLQLGLKSHVSLWSGMVFSINYLTFGIMAPIWGSVSDRSGKKLMMLRAGIGMTITYSLMAFAKNPLQLLLIRGLNGMISGWWQQGI